MKKGIALMAAFMLASALLAESGALAAEADDGGRADYADDDMLLFLSAGCMLPYFRVHAAGGGAQHLAGIAFSAGAMAVDGATGLTLALDVSAGALHADRLPCTSAEGAHGDCVLRASRLVGL